MIPAVFALFNWQVMVYAQLSLTVIRLLPIALSLGETEGAGRNSVTYSSR